MTRFSVPPNQRINPRCKVAKNAHVIYPDSRGTTEVIIKDLSVGGARVQLKSPTDLSGEFNLFVPLEKMLYTGTVRWMKGNVVGVRFVSEPQHVALKVVS